MFLPETLGWLEAILLASAIVFIISLLGNLLSFGGRVANAIVTAILFGVIMVGLVQYEVMEMNLRLTEQAQDALNAQQRNGADGSGETQLEGQ